MTGEQATARALELLQLVGITDGPRRLEQYPHHLSGGMRQRVMIAIGLACNPKLIIADEPTTALDVTIQAQILELMKDLSRRLGIALVVITHNLGIVARYADRVNVMYAARIVEQGTADHVFLEPAHPYAIGLMRSIPRLDLPRGIKLETIEGLPPDLRNAAARLPFRAALSATASRHARRSTRRSPTVAPGHASACIRANEISRRHAGRAAAAAARPRRDALAQNGAEPLLVVDHLKKYFAVKAAGAGFLSSRDRDREGGRRRLDPRHAGRDARARRRVRLRQDHGRSRGAAARRADRRRRSASAAPTSRTPATPTCAACGARSR